MGFWRTPLFVWVFLRPKYLFKRRYTFAMMMAFLLSVGYFFFLFPSERLPNKAQHKTFSSNFTETYPSAFKQEIEKSATEITSTAKTLTGERHFSRPAGHLNVHMWNGICGTKVDVLRYWPHFPYFPDDHSFISDFQKTQVPTRKNKGERVFGFIHPQKSGEYKFALTASNDGSELWLSPNEDPASSEMIACGYFSYGSDYNRYPEQISKEITLLAGKKYYIESLIKQGHGLTAHVAVYWSYNSSTFEIISSKYLSSFYVNNNESVPPHAGIKRNNSLLQKKSNFHNLPFINKREYRSNIPTCLYNPSFLVRNKLQRYQGIMLTIESHVFPQDDTDMIENFGNWRKRNQLIDKNIAESVVDKLMKSLSSRKGYFLRKIHKVIHKPDSANGDRFLLNLELGLKDTNQSFRLSEHVYQQKGNDTLCLPEGINWNSSAKVYFILPVKDQGNWVHYFINQLTDASSLTNDTNFHVIVIDFESKDIDMAKAFNTTLLSSRHTIVSLTGKFYKTLALNKGVEMVPNAHDIVFLFDLHIDVPTDLLDNVRMNTIAGRMAYFPVVGRLECDSSSVEHRGFWQMNGYGLMAIYKSDWDRFWGMNMKNYKYNWGGEDWDLLDRVLMLPLEVERVRHPGLYHHYHDKQRKWN